MSQNDGGPAFPRPMGMLEESTGTTLDRGEWGISLHDYFVAHAPAQQWGFDVFMAEPKPRLEETAPETPERALALQTRALWDDEWEKQRALQWPHVWADAMLAEKRRREEERRQ